jgi:hypothetical protein
MNAIADHIARRQRVNIEGSSDGDALILDSVYGAISKQLNASLSGTTLTVKKSDDSTLGTITATSDAAALPTIGISPD